jgi:hypothetical protein
MDKIENIDSENNNSVSYIYSNNPFPIEYKNKDVYISKWKKFDGEFVSKGELVAELDFNHLIGTINLYSGADGIIEILKMEYSFISKQKEFLKEGDIIFKIHKEPFIEKQKELRNKRFSNIPFVLIDEFTSSKTIKWTSVAGQTKTNEYDSKIYDSIILKDEQSNRLFFTFNNIANKDYILFKSAIRELNLNPGMKISLLFSSGEILTYEIINKSYIYMKNSYWGTIVENKMAITFDELMLFENFDLIKWKIEFPENEIKIYGKIDSEDIQYSIKKFAKDYKDIVKIEIDNYQPLYNKEINTSSSYIENCFVYLMIDHVNNYHKIGISNSPEYREKTLQSEKPTIELICNKKFPNRKIAKSFEQALHHAYSKKRIRGEWFSLDFNDIEDIKEALK